MTHHQQLDAGSVSEEIARLTDEIGELTKEKDMAEATVRKLREAEDFEAGIYHNEQIFNEQQKKLRIEAEILTRENKIKRLTLDRDMAVDRQHMRKQ